MGVQVDYTNKVDVTRTVGDKKYGLDTVFITGAGYYNEPFRGISRDSALGWEEAVWSGSLNRTTDFALNNIGSVSFGLVARVELEFKYENIADYKKLMEIAKERVCYVTYFRRDLGEWVENQEMAFTGNELDKLYGFKTDYIGVLGVKIKLVATNRDKVKNSYTITLNANGGTISGATSYTKTWCDSLDLGKVEITSSTGETLKMWANASTEAAATKKFYKSALLTVTDDLTLYAIWE